MAAPLWAQSSVKQESTLTANDGDQQQLLGRALNGDGQPFTAAVGYAPAKTWVEKPDAWFWDIMPSTTVQRVVTVGNDSFRTPKLGCPVHGSDIYSVNAYYPWVVDVEAEPHKIKCPIGGETYPSNDYAAGDMTTGPYADDGSGFVDENGTRYHFIGLYAHYAYNTALQPAIKSFGDAYMLTGDERYAHKAAVCLLKEAFEYPNSTDRASRTYIPGYKMGSGMITDVVWSSMTLVASARCYDQIVGAIEGDGELLAFAQERIDGIESGDDIRLYIEDNLLRPGIQAIIDRAIQPNTGWGAEAMANLGLVLNDFGDKRPNTADCLEWLYYGAGRMKTAGNQFYKDGGSYSSTGYNDARGGIIRAAEVIARLRELNPHRFDADRYPDVGDREKLLRFTDTYKPAIQMLGGPHRYCVGDIGAPTTTSKPNTGDNERPTEFLDGLGAGFLRSGSGEDQRDVTMFYGGLRGHAHYDPLMFGMHGFGRDLLPNVGYPQSWNFAHAWEWSLFTHKTVVVDRDEKPSSTTNGSLVTWYQGDGVQVMEASKRPYRRDQPRGEDGPDVTDYRRLSALIDLGHDQFYAVDIFRVTGGKDHLQTWHGAYTPNPVSIEGVVLTEQSGGTLAGENVEYGERYKDADGNERWDPYCYLRDVARGPMSGTVSIDYPYDTQPPVHVRLNFVPVGDTELITARGGAPIAPDKQVLQWAIPHRSGDEGLRSQFVTVIEAYPQQQRALGAIRPLPIKTARGSDYEPIALEIEVPGGRDIIFAGGSDNATLTGDGFAFTGRFALVRERGGKVVAMHMVEGTNLTFAGRRLTLPPAPQPAKIVAVDRDARRIVIAGRTPDADELEGRRILIDNHGERLASYTVVAAERLGGNRVALTLDSAGNIGEGVAAGFEDGVILNGPQVNMPLAGLCEIDGRLDYSDCFYFGGHLETGKPGVDVRVRGVMGFPYQAWGLLHEAGINHVHLIDPTPAVELETTIGEGATWIIYEYGVGDEVRFDRGVEEKF
jgi:hypothetical protein